MNVKLIRNADDIHVKKKPPFKNHAGIVEFADI